jgi:broad specificity phosphatase PhoE
MHASILPAVTESTMRAHKLLAALAFAGLSAVSVAEHQEPPLPGLAAVLPELRNGGLVVYFRHTSTEPGGPADQAADLERCETQRNLSARGRQQAGEIGAAVRTLGIPIGTVLSSPFCRCKDTARIAFGRVTVEPDLFFAIRSGAAETARLAEALRRMLSTPPAAGTNTVIVAHTANLREAADIWPKPEGVAYVFRPLPGGGFEPVARAVPEDWATAAEAR